MSKIAPIELRETLDLEETHSKELNNHHSHFLRGKNKKQCRICLQEDQNVISVCHCDGSLKYVHQRCMKNWAQKLLLCTQEENNTQILCCGCLEQPEKDGITCQICGYFIPVESQFKFSRLSCPETYEKLLGERRGEFITLVTLEIIFFVGLLVTITQLPSLIQGNNLKTLDYILISLWLAVALFAIIKSFYEIFRMIYERTLFIVRVRGLQKEKDFTENSLFSQINQPQFLFASQNLERKQQSHKDRFQVVKREALENSNVQLPALENRNLETLQAKIETLQDMKNPIESHQNQRKGQMISRKGIFNPPQT